MLPFTVLFTDTQVTITPVLIHGTLEVSAQPPACWLLINCAVVICLALFLRLPTDRYLALLSFLPFGVFQNGLVGLDRLPEGKP